jgi:hypothetical protein
VAAILTRMAEVGALASVGPETADREAAIADVAACASAYETLAPRFEQPPRRRTLLVTALVARAGRASADRWCRKMRFGREYAGPAVLTAERREALLARLRDGRKMRPSRLYFLLESLPSETLAYLWATGEGRVAARVEEYVTVLSRVRPEVTGEDLIAFGVEPGPAFAGILAQARADRLDERAVGREAELANLKRLARREAR